MAICNNQQPKKRGRSKASSLSNLESISLEDDDIPQVPIVNMERPLGVKAEKERLKKQKCREGTTSHIEDILNVMMEERRKISAMKMACIEKGRLVDQEHEMARIQLKDKKLEIARMKMELDMKRSKEEYEMEKLRMEKLKEDNEMEKLRMNQMKEEKELMMMDISMLLQCSKNIFINAKWKFLKNEGLVLRLLSSSMLLLRMYIGSLIFVLLQYDPTALFILFCYNVILFHYICISKVVVISAAHEAA